MKQAPENAADSIVEFASRSDVGRLRARNEDVLRVDSQYRWAVLADGMGGYRGGDVAANLGVETVVQRLEAAYVPGWSAADAAAALSASIDDANTEICSASGRSVEFANMGSTLVAAIFLTTHVVSAHVGDSRLYRLRDSQLVQLTHDHTVLQEQIDAGMISREDARYSPARGLLTRGLGVDAAVMPTVGLHSVRAGDFFLLCSDGLTDMLDDDEIAVALDRPGSLDAIADDLIDWANSRGGRDNVSVIIARIVV